MEHAREVQLFWLCSKRQIVINGIRLLLHSRFLPPRCYQSSMRGRYLGCTAAAPMLNNATAGVPLFHMPIETQLTHSLLSNFSPTHSAANQKGGALRWCNTTNHYQVEQLEGQLRSHSESLAHLDWSVAQARKKGAMCFQMYMYSSAKGGGHSCCDPFGECTEQG